MATPDGKGDDPRTVLQAQVDLILNGFPGGDGGLEGAAIEWSEPGQRVNYLYRARSLLVRDADVNRVMEIVPSRPVEHNDNVRGLTLLEFTNETRSVDEVCAILDRVLGEGVATPDHIFYVCPDSICPATEPEEVPQDAKPHPPVSTDAGACDGSGVLVAVLDTGWLPDAVSHPWLTGVTGEREHPLGGYPVRILPYAGHGTFVAGVVRTMAPKAAVWVSRTFEKVGATFESHLVKKMSDALKLGAEVISMDFGTNTRKDIPSLGFEIVKQQLEYHPNVVLVAAAGNNSSRRPFWPAAYCWTVSVGALDTDCDARAEFSDYGSWVDVYAPGEGLVNAFATGNYQCDEPPNTGRWRTFNGMCKWSGTSFSTPIVSGLIAARISGTGENGPQAAQALLARARAHRKPRVGPVILPGQACRDDPD